MELTFEQLPKAVAQILETLNRIEFLLKQKNGPALEENKLLTVQETAEFLNLSVPTIYGLIHKMGIPCNKKGKRVYFIRTDLVEWIKSGRRKTIYEIKAEADNYLLKSKNRRNCL